MPMIWGGNRSAWDFTNPSNLVWNKSLQQNLNELNVGLQVMGLAIPEALAYKAAAQIQTGLAAKAISGPVALQSSAAGVSAAGGAGLAAGGLALATTGLKVGAGVFALDWLKKNWWIAALIIGGLIAYKVVSKE